MTRKVKVKHDFAKLEQSIKEVNKGLIKAWSNTAKSVGQLAEAMQYLADDLKNKITHDQQTIHKRRSGRT